MRVVSLEMNLKGQVRYSLQNLLSTPGRVIYGWQRENRE